MKARFTIAMKSAFSSEGQRKSFFLLAWLVISFSFAPVILWDSLITLRSYSTTQAMSWHFLRQKGALSHITSPASPLICCDWLSINVQQISFPMSTTYGRKLCSFTMSINILGLTIGSKLVVMSEWVREWINQSTSKSLVRKCNILCCSAFNHYQRHIE